jgi:hypothetical protein
MHPNVSLKRDATFAVFALGVVAATSILGQMAEIFFDFSHFSGPPK